MEANGQIRRTRYSNTMTTQAAYSEHSEPHVAPNEDADVHSSSQEYAARFGGATGEWMLAIQERAVARMLPTDTTSILDVGGGHGQIALPLSKGGKSVTILGSSIACSALLRSYIESGVIGFQVGNLLELPYHDRSFDAVVSFRLISHCKNWQTLIAEMCRVAHSTIIFDYPVWLSANFLTPLLFRVKRMIEGNTRHYRIFTTRELTRECRKHGFECVELQKQFFFPMGLHRALKSRKISALLENVARCAGLTALFGSPVIIRFQRRSDAR